MLSAWKQTLLIIVTYSALLLTAKIFAKTETKQGRTAQPPTRATNILPAANLAPDQRVAQTNSQSLPQAVGAVVEPEPYPQDLLEPTPAARKNPSVAR
jgi:hypothetical protein